MNASETLSSATPRAAAPIHDTHKFKLLLKREFWEHKGGFFWAPIVAGGILIAMSILGAITGSLLYRSAVDNGKVNWDDMSLNGAKGVDAAHKAFGIAGDVNLLTGVGFTSAILVFVVFFYALGALYDERKDRSVLFWKSLPVSDTQTVLSKATWALVLAPLLAVGIGLLIGIVQWVVSAVTMAILGIPGASGFFSESHPFRVITNVLMALPVYTLWALPTVGWLMLCSAWARSKPFLWAVLIPILGSTVISWLGTLPGIDINHQKVWYLLAYRGLLSVVPGTWFATDEMQGLQGIEVNGPEDIAKAFDYLNGWQVFGSIDIWLGAVIGAAMIYGAILLRRRRELAD